MPPCLKPVAPPTACRRTERAAAPNCASPSPEPLPEHGCWSVGKDKDVMLINEYKGGGRQARIKTPKARGGFFYRLFMRWFGGADLRH